jgi:hypothetical protein
MKIRLYQQRISDEYFANLAKLFDDTIFYVYYINKDIFKFSMRVRIPKFDDFIHGERYLTVGYGSLQVLKNEKHNCILVLKRHPSLTSCFFLPLMIPWSFLCIVCANKIRLLCKTA